MRKLALLFMLSLVFIGCGPTLPPGNSLAVKLLGPDDPTGTFTRWENQTIPW